MKQQKEKHKPAFGFLWILRQTKGGRGSLAAILLSSIGMTIANISMGLILKSFVDIATGDTNLELSIAVWIALAIILLEGVSFLVLNYFNSRFKSKIEGKMRIDLLGAVENSRLLEIQRHHSGEFLTRLTNDIQTVANCVPSLIRDIFSGVLSAILSAFLLFWFSWKLALIILIAFPLLLVSVSLFSPILQKRSRIDKENEENSRTFLQEVLGNLLLFKTYHMKENNRAKLSKLNQARVKSAVRLGIMEGVSAFSNNFMGTAMFLLALGAGAYFVLQGEIVVGSMIAIIQLLNYVIWPFANIAGSVSQVNQSIISGERIGEILSMPKEAEASPHIYAPVSGSAALSVREVDFSYVPGEKTLEQVCARFPADSLTAVIGKSGSGKSTLLKLLIGLYTPDSGAVSLEDNGRSLMGVQITPYVSYVPSTDFIFTGTVRENICMSDACPDEARMREAARQANIHEFIESLPKQYETRIGEKGNALSSGQGQRVAIARALYKGSGLLVFDEPTANLDPASIHIFREMLRTIAKGKICILVTHDVGTAKLCDFVYTMEHGRLAETSPDLLSLEDMSE